MSADEWDPWGLTFSRFQSGDHLGAVRLLEDYIAADKRRPFSGLVGHSFSNSSDSIIAELNRFISHCETTFRIDSLYLEMNGFDINPDRWYVDFFGYDHYSTVEDDLDWLCDWQSPDFPSMTLIGLEDVQRDFDCYHEKRMYKDKSYKALYETACNLVMSKFVLLIEDTLRSRNLVKPIPVLATAHDFEPLGRFEPEMNEQQ